MSDENNLIVEKITSPHKITLYRKPNYDNIYYYFRWKNKTYRGSTGTTIQELSKMKVLEVFFEITKGKRTGVKQKVIRFEDVVKKFLKNREEYGISKRTLKDYERQSKYLLEFFKGKEIQSICSKSVYNEYRHWRKNYYETHEKKSQQVFKRNGQTIKGRTYDHVGPVRLNRDCRLLVSILRYCKEEIESLKDLIVPSYKMLPEKPRTEILEKDEYQKLHDYWMNKNPYYWYIISFVNNTGIRYPNELLKIQWKDVHLDKSFVEIKNRKNRNINQPLHTGVPLVGTSREIIETLKSRDGVSTGDDDFVFVNDNNRQIKDIGKAFKKSLIECGINKDLTMYSLRHLFASRMSRRPEVPLKILSEVLGHKDTTMVDRRYSHLRTRDLVKVFEETEKRRQEILQSQKENHQI